MLSIHPLLVLTIFASQAAGSSMGNGQQAAERTVARTRVAESISSAPQLPGREQDARVAQIAYRLAIAGRTRCPALQPATGLVLQHLSQFQLTDRAAISAALPLTRGPGVIVVVPDSPAGKAGIRPGDVLLAVQGAALPQEADLAAPFDARRAHARADTITDLLSTASPLTVTLLREDAEKSVRLTPLPACPSHVHLARSAQRNAFADGRHVFLTTGVLALLHNDDELAFIIAHEMAHNILGHAAVMRGPTVRRGIARTLGESGRIVRETENAADTLGGELMIDAGYDPVAGAAILARLGGAAGIALFASHASAATRMAALRALAEARRAR